MQTTIKHLKSGKISIEVRDHLEEMERGVFVSVESAERFGDIGDEACVGIVSDVSPNACRSGDQREYVFLEFDEDGIRGNSNPSMRSLHGWRGTTNDRSVSAHGWRRIEESSPLKRGHGWRTVFSADLRQD